MFARRAGRVVGALVFALLGACGDDATAPDDGSLAVGIEGLPLGVQPAVTVTGPRGFTVAVTSSDTLTALARGRYTVVASEVTAGGARYAATPATQMVDVAGGRLAASGISYALASARLTVSVLGLPGGAAATVSVSGPGGYGRALTGSTSLELLEPGTYTITAADVLAAGKTYRAAPATQTVALAASASPAAATVAYGAGRASLDVTIAGLPVGIDASVAVAGPDGYARTLTSATRLEYLEAGRYTISAAVVGSNLTTHEPAPGSQTVDVGDGGTSAAAVIYGSTPLRLGVRLVAEGLTEPVFLTAPDGDARQFVAERNGRVRIIENGALLAPPFLDIRSRVNFVGERGLLGMAFDPQYAANGYVYVYYVNLAGDVVLERIASTPGSNAADAGGAGIVITIPHNGSEHHGGMIAFGPDGMLYLAPGDGACCGDPQNNAQKLSTLLGKMLRIDVRALPYSIPAGNPFVGQAGARPEIWAYGLRSPWRFSFDAPAAMLYLGDVGQDAHEEVNVVPASAAGLNYGWPLMEGIACYRPSMFCTVGVSLTLPVVAYPHAEGCSVTGGYVYRGAAIPALTGHYLYADYCRGWLRSFRSLGGGGAFDQRSWPDVSLPRVVSFGRDGAGELYMVGSGRVWMIVRQ